MLEKVSDIAIEEKLRHSVLLSSLTNQQFKLLFEDAELRHYELGEVIAEIGKPCDGLHILVSGKIRLIKRNEKLENTTLYTMAYPGDSFGAESVQNNAIFAYGARAAETARVIKVSAAKVSQVAHESAAFYERLEQAIFLTQQYLKISDFPVFKYFSYWQLRPLLLACSRVCLDSGEFVNQVVGDDPREPSALAIVLQGTIENAKGKLQAGDWFGNKFTSLATGDGLLKCQTNTELLLLSQAAYQQLCQYNPELVSKLNHILTTRNAVEPRQFLNDLASSVRIFKSEDTRPLLEEPVITRFRKSLGKYPFIRQQSAMDCGAACLSMISSFYGKNINLNYLRDLAGVSRYGTTMLALAESAEKLGFVSRGIRASYEGLLKLKPPLICHWEQNHFVVLYEIKEASAVIGDPAEGVLKVSRDEFGEGYSGVALELVPTQKFGKDLKVTSPLALFVPLMLPFRALVGHIFVGTFLLQTLMLLMPLFTQVIVDKVIVHQSLSMLNMMLLGMVIFTLFQTLIAFLRGFLLAYLSMKVDQSLFVHFFKHLLSLPLKFFEDRTIGDVLARFGENEKIRNLLAGSGITVLLDVLTTGVYLAIMFFYNCVFGLSVMFYLTLFVIVVVCYTPYLKSLSRRVFDKHVASNSYLVECIRGIERLKSAAIENRARWHWEALFVEALNVKFQEVLASNVAQVVSRLVQLGGQVLLLWLGAQMVIKNELTIGQLMALNMMVGMASQPLLRVVEMWDQLQDVNISFERLGDVLQAEAEEPDSSRKLVLPNLQGCVKFEDVTFRYSSMANMNTLVNVSFEAHPGQMIAVVGKSGSGKSTLVKLLQGLYVIDQGRILIDGHDLQHICLADLRKQMGVVSQQEYIFRGTIRENLAFYKAEASFREIIETAKLAGIHEFISSLPYGYETQVNEGAFNLSGGQRQRIAIARAVLHNPKILIFDEATSALDSDSEQAIQKNLATIRQGRTIFVVAHRLSTVREANLILVLDRGQIVERGTHEELSAERGLYYYLSSQQLNL